MRHINYRYEFPHESVYEFEYAQVNDIVAYWGYDAIEDDIERCSQDLIKNPGSRQAISVLNNGIYNMTCLISVQWLLVDEELFCIANFRSQHEKYGRPHDERFLNYLTTKMHVELTWNGQFCECQQICVNVADYHSY